MTTETPLAPTVEAIDAWRAQQKRNEDGSTNGWEPFYGVNVWTKGGSCRYITGREEQGGFVFYETIRGEGSSNGCRTTFIRADKIIRAVGVYG